MQPLLWTALSLLLLTVLLDAAVPPDALERNIPEDYSDVNLESFLGKQYKRSGGCVRRGGSCDGKPNDCCPNSACRCNLWGTNCRCERQGLLQQWGRRRK
ncbi:hypothetical protein JTE90_002177 [Oedothorax gibbosus]|uniref:U8-agatoxin-Ao1a n=1 Tax=Oedothorax gibbosus TaxID=931172 RepID=A0AAV6VIW1_9ARAC|nr:hypothetical protein JTE90_002177 [Oedothorax gibbosus]